jgi:hypothetical protein
VSFRDFFAIPALIMFVLGVLLSGWVMSLFGGAKSKVSGGG